MIPQEFEPYLDFWLEGQKKGFAGDLPRTKLPDGSKRVVLFNKPVLQADLLYVDRWYGSDLGGGQTILYHLPETTHPIFDFSNFEGKPIARLGYSGEIVRRFTKEEMKNLEEVFGSSISQSDIIWKVLKSALSKVTKERPLRGPGRVSFSEFPAFCYLSEEKRAGENRIVGDEEITFFGIPCFLGNYDFTLIKKNLEDKL